jgi:hypothetical protein
MSIIYIFAQLDATFGKPDAQAILLNDTNFCAPLLLMKTPETLFLQLEECQEVQILALNPYTNKQLIINAVIVLQKANIFPTKDFDDWEALPIQTWASMKTFFQKSFTLRLNAISMHPTLGQHGYANPNPYTIFDAAHKDIDTSTASTHHAMATKMVPPVRSTLRGSTLSQEVASALAQLSHNQNTLMMQMAALSVIPPQQPPNLITISTGNQFT